MEEEDTQENPTPEVQEATPEVESNAQEGTSPEETHIPVAEAAPDMEAPHVTAAKAEDFLAKISHFASFELKEAADHIKALLAHIKA